MFNNNNNKISVHNYINNNYSVNLDEIRFEIVYFLFCLIHINLQEMDKFK